jgi:hypothetical protein
VGRVSRWETGLDPPDKGSQMRIGSRMDWGQFNFQFIRLGTKEATGQLAVEYPRST